MKKLLVVKGIITCTLTVLALQSYATTQQYKLIINNDLKGESINCQYQGGCAAGRGSLNYITKSESTTFTMSHPDADDPITADCGFYIKCHVKNDSSNICSYSIGIKEPGHTVKQCGQYKMNGNYDSDSKTKTITVTFSKK